MFVLQSGRNGWLIELNSNAYVEYPAVLVARDGHVEGLLLVDGRPLAGHAAPGPFGTVQQDRPPEFGEEVGGGV